MRSPTLSPFRPRRSATPSTDFVRVLNKSLDTLGLRGSIVERLLARTLAVPAARFFRMRRSVSLLISERPDGTHGLIEGTYQSPILVQWDRAPRETRVLDVTLSELQIDSIWEVFPAFPPRHTP